MKLTVFGTGYVGLVQATVLADAGHTVCCVDKDENKVSKLIEGIIPIYEPGLSALVKKNYEAGRLIFTTNAAEGVDFAEIQFIAVGTPPGEDGSADLQYVLAVAETIASHMHDKKVVINKSTVPVGTADKVKQRISEVLSAKECAFDFHVVSNPEFLKEGSAVSDCQKPDRIIIGTDSEYVIALMRELYEPFSRNHEKIIVMDVRSAELTKYTANCLLATKISFMNEIACLAEMLGADVESVRKGIGADQRIGYQFIYPGCGYGGSCFPKDVKALEHTAQQMNFVPHILNAVETVNKNQKRRLFEQVKFHYENNLRGKTFALWGLAFKPNTDDMREASSLELMSLLWEAGANVQAYDPKAMEEAQKLYPAHPNLRLMGTKEAALQGADGLIIVTEWQDFKAPDFDVIKKSLKDPVIFDGRNIFDPARVAKQGFHYYGIGRGLSVRPVL
ncbi:UDP-glucose 6-dehydrogenase [Pseudomonas sp. RIT-PI-q]|uniref:UDP-glucose dehydrogenase family protein n=1 Tax=Pseudomonas sp. RIT-PI-q TaxID=1690247 RepID=UPI0006CCF20E|nr:UDP-glucose/GDP-mannose dehydrogenase family protein [Pseudomonas sp. RIT-PI-q]KPG98516.1 UDP-glucose 6-dehydrogenase [Pseudomonas sp. RIT-PI-q]